MKMKMNKKIIKIQFMTNITIKFQCPCEGMDQERYNTGFKEDSSNKDNESETTGKTRIRRINV